jgi:hypothetical protein
MRKAQRQLKAKGSRVQLSTLFKLRLSTLRFQLSTLFHCIQSPLISRCRIAMDQTLSRGTVEQLNGALLVSV